MSQKCRAIVVGSANIDRMNGASAAQTCRATHAPTTTLHRAASIRERDDATRNGISPGALLRDALSDYTELLANGLEDCRYCSSRKVISGTVSNCDRPHPRW